MSELQAQAPYVARIAAGRAAVELEQGGAYAYFLDGRRITRARSQAKAVDGRAILTRDAALESVKQRAVVDELGHGVQMDARYTADNGLILVQRLTVYEELTQMTAQVLLSDSRGEVETRFLAPVDVVYPGKDVHPLFLTYAQRMLLVPYDNDMWVRYEVAPLRPGRTSYDVTAIFDPERRYGLVLGALDHDVWKNAISCTALDARTWMAYSGIADAGTHDCLPHGALVGDEVPSARFTLGWHEDVRAGLEAFGDLCAAVRPPLPWPHPVPFGWNSWSGLGAGLTLESWQEAGDFLHDELQPAGYGSEDGVVYVNLDAAWTRFDLEAMAAYVKTIHDRGQKAGIYGGPFVFLSPDGSRPLPGCPGVTYGDIFLKDEKGVPLPRIDGLQALDVTHPAWKQSITYQINQFVDWGFDYVKIDFLCHGALEAAHADPEVRTGRQALVRGYETIVDLLRPERIGRPFFISLSIAPVFPHGFGHARRCSCDAFGHIDDTEYMLNAATFAWWQSGRLYRFNDPDHIALYHSAVDGRGPTTLQEGRARYTAATLAGTVMMLSDNYGPTGDAAQHQAARDRALALSGNAAINAVAQKGQAFTPVELKGAEGCDTFVLHAPEGHYVALFNFTQAPRRVSVDLERAALPASGQAVNLWNGVTGYYEGQLAVMLDPCDAAILKIQG